MGGQAAGEGGGVRGFGGRVLLVLGNVENLDLVGRELVEFVLWNIDLVAIECLYLLLLLDIFALFEIIACLSGGDLHRIDDDLLLGGGRGVLQEINVLLVHYAFTLVLFLDVSRANGKAPAVELLGEAVALDR